MNNIKLRQKVNSAIYNILQEKNYVSPVNVLMDIGILSVKDYENWRFGRVPYLEKVCRTNLNKLSLVMKELKVYARNNNLKPSRTAYCLDKEKMVKEIDRALALNETKFRYPEWGL